MPVFRGLLALVLVTILSACAPKTKVRDIPRSEATWLNGRRVVAEGSQLKMIFDSDGEHLNIRKVDYKVYDGELYLWPVRAAESFQPVVFTLDTATMKLRSPWNDHVYWVEAVDWDNVVGRIARPSPLGDRVDRVKADVLTP